MSGPLLHLLPLSDYRADPMEPIRSPTLETEGFVHCSPDIATTIAVGNTLYRDADGPMVAVELDPAKLDCEVRWEAPAPAPPAGVAPDVLFPHVFGPLNRDAIVGVRYARRDMIGYYVDFLRRSETAEALDLVPHPEGGWFRRTWTSATEVEARSGTRPSATAIHFLLHAGETSAWHTVSSDELWFWHSGGPITLSLGGHGNDPTEPGPSLVLNGDITAGQQPQVLVPAGTWQRAHAEVETLVSCVVSPGFDFADFRTV